MEENQDNKDQSFSGSYAGLTTFIKTFHCDTNRSFVSASNEVPGYYFTLHSQKRQLWSLQGKEVIVGIGNAFDVPEYKEYLNTLPRQVRVLLWLDFGKNNFDCKEPLLFAVNNTISLTPSRNGLFRLRMPDRSVQIFTDPYIEPSPFGTTFIKQFVNDLGERTDKWLRSQFKFIEDKRQQFANTWKNIPDNDGE